MALLALLWNHLKPFETIWNHKSATFPEEIFTWSYRKATGSTKSDLRTSIRIRGSLDHLVLRHLRRSHPGKAGFFYPPEDPGGHWVCFLVSSIWYLMEAPPFDFFELSDGFWYDQPNFSRGCKDRGIQRHSFSGQKCVDYIGPMPQQRYQHGAVIPKGPRMVYAWMFLSPFFCLKQIKKNVSETFFHERTVRKLELKHIFELRFARECTKGWIRMEPVWNNGSTSFTSSTLAGFFNANNLQNNGRLQDCMVKGPEPPKPQHTALCLRLFCKRVARKRHFWKYVFCFSLIQSAICGLTR